MIDNKLRKNLSHYVDNRVWWEKWFSELKKDGHNKLLNLFLDLKTKNPKEFKRVMEQIDYLNTYGILPSNISKKEKAEFWQYQLFGK